ncbi:ABC transporter ATP-binding protein [Candidatus Aquicultor secundus]|uniref:ABC transporter ATP-binding protein n=1 Tax=Candidatus Aquicultor secundus TaxID=1973895 RepID=A0A2M7T9R7_9ACTN|nr:ABC transporter ATP-binding protein [Candidatus Aquicultor secundus]PIX51293.1 MAG: ABC transporter ATP-binding protein [Candidatus Aquicultor secundus]PIZ41464.1 MAG: ABC transporter ATP-binding protein [Candidatus Aquicultor secundus]PJB79934.1 MAG: ABC transporter ATP-binding protein [Candidatus Aquicultor secundus]
MPDVDLLNVGVDYEHLGRTVTALDGVDLHVPAGDALAIIGPSGCGKSTLLYTLSGLIKPTRGSIRIDGDELQGQRLQTALILQDYGLFQWNTVFDNAALGLRVRHIPKGQIKERVGKILKRLGLWEMRDRYPGQLSGGQRQRVAIARSLSLEPDLLLMDEPFSSLDALTREELQNTVLDIWLERKTNGKVKVDGNGNGHLPGTLTVVLVTHSIEEAAFLGRRIAVMGINPGRITSMVDNEEMGEADYRNTPGFYDHCAKLRGMLKDGVRVG